MLLTRVLAGVRGAQGRACAFGLLVVLVALVPLAHTSPPDPLWIAGIYDAADFDDVVVAATSLDSQLEGHPFIVSPVTIVAYILPVARVEIPTATTLRSVHSRAPPPTS
jgi:hypothetical protein